jgi:hypothetical protein
MTHHDDSMRLLRTQRSNHSKPLHRPLALTVRQAPPSGFARRTTCSSRPRRRKHPVAQVTMRNNCTTSRKAYNTRQARHCPRLKCSTARIIQRKSHDSRRNSTSSTVPARCMAAASSKASNRSNRHMTKYQLSDSRGQALHLRHCPPSLGMHQQHNTTLRDKAFPVVHHLPKWRLLSFPPSIHNPRTRNLAHPRNNHTECWILHSRPHTRHTISNRNMLHPNLLSNSRRPSISCSTNTRSRYERFSHGLARATYATRPTS